MFRVIEFVVTSMAVNIIFSNLIYFRDTHCTVKFEGLVLTGTQFLVSSAITGLILALF